MPRLWNATIDAHRRAVREAILDATWKLATEQGLASVTMSRIAEQAGIGRATLYKYFADVRAVMDAWHLRHVTEHLERLTEVRNRTGNAGDRLEAVLGAYAQVVHHRGQQGAEPVALLQTGEHAARARELLEPLFRDLVIEAAQAGNIRTDVAPDELALYCLHALGAASALPSETAVERLVDVTLGGLRRPG